MEMFIAVGIILIFSIVYAYRLKHPRHKNHQAHK